MFASRYLSVPVVAAAVAVSGCGTSPNVPSSTVPASFRIMLPIECAAIFDKREFIFDGSSSGTPADVSFASANLDNSLGLSATIAVARRATTGVLGTGSRFARARDGYQIQVTDRRGGTAGVTLRGHTSGTRELSGTFDGSVYVVDYVFSIGNECVATDFSWSLTNDAR
jgi:hypothetical protein